MKVNNIIGAALCALLISPALAAANAQPAKSVIVDSVNKQLRKSAKPAKANSTTGALRVNAAASKTANGTATKTARVVPVPVFTSPSSQPSPKVVRVSASPDSGIKKAPPVRRAAKAAKSKPPTR